MKLIVQGLILALLLGLLGERSYAAYTWKQQADLANQQAVIAYHWLHDPVVTAQGRSLSRADLVDIVLSKALRPAAPAADSSSSK